MTSSSRQRSRSYRKRKNHRYSSSSQNSSRSYRANKRYLSPSRSQRDSSDYYSLKSKSDISNHFILEDKKQYRRNVDDRELKHQLQKILKDRYGSINHISRFDESQASISYKIGFKYDEDALQFSDDTEIIITIGKDKIKLEIIPTVAFDKLIPVVKEMKKKQKREKQKRRKERQRQQQKKRQIQRLKRDKKYKHKQRRSSSNSSSNSKSYQRKRSKSRNGNNSKDYKTLCILGLPTYIKSKQITNYLQHHKQGPFFIGHSKMCKLHQTNFEYMEIVIDGRKANKLLSIRQNLSIQDYPILLVEGFQVQKEEQIKSILRNYQIKITLPDRVNPFYVFKAFSECGKVVQMISNEQLKDGKSGCYIVTLNCNNKAQKLRKLGRLSSNIKLEETSGTLVYRPTKTSKLFVDGQ